MSYNALLQHRRKTGELGKLGDCRFQKLDDFLETTPCPPHQSFNLPPADRIVAIGDVHADFDKLLRALEIAGAIDGKCAWQPRKTPLVIVLVGDILDQGGRMEGDAPIVPQERNVRVELDIIQFLFALDAKARLLKQGRVFVTLGNHELSNFAGDFSGTTEATNQGWGGQQGRARAFARGGLLANLVARSWPMILCLGKVVFTHAGLVSPADRTFASFEEYVDTVNKAIAGFITTPRAPLETWISDLTMTREVSLNFQDDVVKCMRFARNVLKPIHAENRVVVVGHTPQIIAWSQNDENGINGVCKNSIWRIDVAMSKAFGSSSREVGVEVLKIGLIKGEHWFKVLKSVQKAPR